MPRFYLLVMFMNACKQNSEKKIIENQEFNQLGQERANDIEPANFSLTLRTLIKQDDGLQLFYIQENNQSYSAERMISKEVKGSDQFQDIIFDLPTKFYPFNLRLDFGNNPTQSSIRIKDCILHYGVNDYVIKGSEMPDFLY